MKSFQGRPRDHDFAEGDAFRRYAEGVKNSGFSLAWVMLNSVFMGELSPELRRVLESENWGELSRRAVELAAAEMNRFRWRGTRKGILPDGYDAPSIGGEAVAELFRGNCKLALPYSREELEREIQRLIHQQIDRLHHRRENRLIRNCADLEPPLRDGRRASVLDTVRDHHLSPDESCGSAEEQKDLERFKIVALERLAGDVEARALFGCFCEGIGKRSAQAAHLGFTSERVKNAAKRLKRKLRNLCQKF
jgi:hypothetical protein